MVQLSNLVNNSYEINFSDGIIAYGRVISEEMLNPQTKRLETRYFFESQGSRVLITRRGRNRIKMGAGRKDLLVAFFSSEGFFVSQ